MDPNTVIAGVIADVILALIAMLGGYAVAFLHRHVGAKKLALGMEIARTVVTAVEQLAVARGWASADKYDHALTRARDLAARLGVTFTDSQWQSLIEGAVAALKRTGAEIAAIAPPSP